MKNKPKAILTKNNYGQIIEIEIVVNNLIMYRYKVHDKSINNTQHLIIAKGFFIDECKRLNRNDILECLNESTKQIKYA